MTSDWTQSSALQDKFLTTRPPGKSLIGEFWPFTFKVIINIVEFSSVQSLSHVQLFMTPWTTAHQASLSIINSRRLLKLMPMESVMSSNYLIPFYSSFQPFPASGSFQMSQFFASRSQSIGVSASPSVLPINTQDWFPLGWTGWTSLQSKGLSGVFSKTTIQKHQLFCAQLSL